MKVHTTPWRRTRDATLAGVMLSFSAPLPAANRSWDGGGANDSWTNGANWNGRLTAPDPGDNLAFPAGSARMSNNNNFAAGTDFNTFTFSAAGYTIAGNSAGLTAGLNVTHGAGNTVLNLPLALNANQTFTVSQSGANLFLNGTVSLGFRVLTIDGAGQTVAAGNITSLLSTGRVVKSGTGTLWVIAAPTYDGSTTVNGGILRVDGSLTNSRAVVNSGGTLRGAGTVNGITANTGGAVSPGWTNPGILESAGDVALNAGSTLNIRLNGTAESNYDHLEVTGSLTLGGTLNISAAPGFVPPVGSVFTLIDNDGSDDVTGTFAGLPEGAVLTLNSRPFQISYGSRFGGIGGRDNDVTLEAIPALCIWDGEGGLNNSWSIPLNWSSNIPPVPGDSIQFASTGNSTVTSNNDFPDGRVVGSVIFDGGNFKLEGNAVQVEGAVKSQAAGTAEILLPMTLLGGVQVTGPALLKLSGNIMLGGSQTFRANLPQSGLEIHGQTDIGDRMLTVVADNNLPILFAGGLSGSGTLRKQGPGTLKLTGTNACAQTTVEGGGLQVESSNDSIARITGAVTVNSGAWMDVWGEVSGDLLVNSGGFLLGGTAPNVGNSLKNVEIRGGTFIPDHNAHVNGTLRMLDGAVFDVEIRATSDPDVDQAGSVALSGPLELLDVLLLVNVGPEFPPGEVFEIINHLSGSTTGTFTGLPNLTRFISGGHAFAISYAGGDVSLTADPPFVWDGGGADTNWTTAGNWTQDLAPIPGAALVFPDGVSQRFAVNDFPPNTAFRSLTFQRNSYIIGGSAFRVTETIANEVSSGPTIIASDLTLQLPQIGNVPLSVNNASELRLSGVVSGKMLKTGSGVLSLSGADDNALTGLLKEGRLELNKSGAVALDSLTIGDGTAAPVLRLLADHQINASGFLTINSQARFELDGHTEAVSRLEGDGTVVLGDIFGAHGRLTLMGGNFGGAITGAGTLTITDDVALAGASSFVGTTILEGGTLSVNGSLGAGQIRLDGGILRGVGQVAAINGNGGTLQAGLAAAGLNVVFRSAGVTLNAASTFRTLLTSLDPGFENPRLSVTGAVDLGGSLLDLDRLTAPPPVLGKTFVLIDNDGTDAVSGTFAGLPQDAQFSQLGMRWQINYAGGDGNDPAVTVVGLLPPALASFMVQAGTGAQAGKDLVGIGFTGIAGVQYDLEGSTDMVNWTLRQTGVANRSDGAISFGIIQPVSLRTCFRVRQR
jgi:autotransporter-associated beta strand protein